MALDLSKTLGSATESAPAEPTFIGKVVLWIGVVVGLVLMGWLSTTMSIPQQLNFTSSLLQQSDRIVALLVVIFGMFLVMFISAVIGSSLRHDVPVFCCAISCGVFSWRGGTMQATLFAAHGTGVFFTLAVETVILFAGLVCAWFALQKARGDSHIAIVASKAAAEASPGSLPESSPESSAESSEEGSLDENLLAVFTQATVMLAMMILLCRSDAKNQAAASVAIASAIGAAVATQFVTVRSSFWLWIGPLAVALFGYIFAAFHAQGWEVGVLHGPLAALARPVPLDYVSMGPAGAIFGYWISNSSPPEADEPATAST